MGPSRRARLSEATLKRRQVLAASNIISQQDLDERTADLASKQAAVKSGQANVDRLEVLANYRKVTAPFDGFVTARDTDLGALISASGGTGLPLFVISDTSRLRVYVNIPQAYVPLIRIGAKPTISVPEYPEQTFPATVEFSSQAVDIASGTTRMQLIVGNDKAVLLPGGYTNVRWRPAGRSGRRSARSRVCAAAGHRAPGRRVTIFFSNTRSPAPARPGADRS